MSGAYAMVSRGTSCSIMTVAAVRVGYPVNCEMLPWHCAMDGYTAYEQFEQMKGITLVGC